MSQLDEGAIVTLVDRILERAAAEGASDVHIEPRADRVRVRFRIDGVLVDRPAFGSVVAAPVVSRLKILARLDISERRLPQDGAFGIALPSGDVDVRLSSFPTEYGEKVVLRLLRRQEIRLDLEGLGMHPALAQRLHAQVNRAHGLSLVTGPTGSGKTSTLYALLNLIDGTRRNIQTLEDPIEYRFEHVVQGQVNEKIGFSFARGLRAMLRQDPDVIMVGEMRDAETADIAFKAALTGHTVLSSLHTSSAIETFVRLFDLGLERYVVASALSVMVGQRLVRCLCARCKSAQVVDADLQTLIQRMGGAAFAQHYTAPGCASCNGTGYRGRIGIYEVIEVDDVLSDLVKSEQTTRVQLRHYMEQRRLHGLGAAGLAKVAAGQTSVEEVLRVV